MMKVKFGSMLVFAIAVLGLGLTVAVYAAEYNFHEQAGLKGCDSVITERGQVECKGVQKAKDNACSVPVECDVDKQERLIVKYKEAKERLDRGQVADADRDKLNETVRLLKEQLDAAKNAARNGTSKAEGCVSAREHVQKWFIEVGIPLTERTRDEALRIRRDLLDKLTDAQTKLREARSKRDAKPGDSSAQSEYERATEEMRNVEKALEQFNNKYSKSIEHSASRLIDHYKAEKDSHDKPLSEAKNRVENCKKVDNMSF